MLHQDVIYGNIELNGIYEKIVNSREFLRLKDITQTAMSTLAYPQLAKETRFEHSIGVYYLMCRTLNNLEKKLSAQGVYFAKEEKDIAKLAALLHDIGHGVHSHLLEKITGSSHEQRSIDIVRDEKTQIHQIIVEQYGEDFIDKLVEFVDCIYGKGELAETIQIQKDHTISLKGVLASLISHNIDLDRLDYLIRESTYTKLGTLTNYQELINSFDIIPAGSQMILAIPEEAMYLLEANIFERTRNYSKIYFNDMDFLGNHAFELLLEELRKHPEEVPDSIPEPIRKLLTQNKTYFSNEEYMQLTNVPLEEAIVLIAKTTENEKIRYLCHYQKNAQEDYQILYNGRDEQYVRKLLKKVIPNFPENSNCIFSETRTIKPYKKTKFGSTNIITKNGIRNFEDLPHAISLQPLQRTVMAMNPQVLRLELGMSEPEFHQKYADMVQEIMSGEMKPRQEFELRYVLAEQKFSYSDILEFIEGQYEIKDHSQYYSNDIYYDNIHSFELLEKGNTLRIRDGATYHNGIRTHSYKEKRITYKTYVEHGEQTYTTRERREEIGDTTNLSEYAEFIDSIGLKVEDLQPILEVNNMRRLITILVNGSPIDLSFNMATYQNYIYDMLGAMPTIEIRPRENEILGRLELLEIKEKLEEAFPMLKDLISNANIYEIGVADSYEKYQKGYIVNEDAQEYEQENPQSAQKLGEIVEKLKQKRGIAQVAKILPVEEFIKESKVFPEEHEIE